MRWTPGGMSGNIEDRRGERAGGGGFRGMGFGGGGARIGLGGMLLLLVLSLIFKKDFMSMFLGGEAGVPTSVNRPASPPASTTAAEEKRVQFVSFVLDDAQKTWTEIFAKHGQRYQPAKLVLFRDAIQSACGFSEAASGPFYCPGDQKVYIDLSFYDELAQRFGAGGDFAQAYVLSHEIGHHVQRLLGTEAQVRRVQRAQPQAANALSVRLELQADCFAGVWGHSTNQRNLLEQGDVEEGMKAAAAIGDDHIQKMSRGRVSPESFTHGSSAQRMEWLKRGLSTGDVSSCNTFSGTGM